MNQELVGQRIRESMAVKAALLENKTLVARIAEVAEIASQVFLHDGKILFCGNGGSAADAQHIAAELSGRFLLDRRPLFAEALHVNPSYVTAVSNDYSFDLVYARLVEAMGRPNDILVCISTSGNSSNILQAAKMAKAQKMKVVGLSGATGGAMASEVDYLINVPSMDTARIQEAHILIGHIWCELIEAKLFKG